MKNVSRRKYKYKSKSKSKSKCKSIGGVRYIKKILEKIVSRINLQLFQKAAFRKSRAKTLEGLKPLSKVINKFPAQNININNLVVDDQIINDILNNK